MRAPAADVNHSAKRWRGLLQDARHWRRVSEGYLRPIAPAPWMVGATDRDVISRGLCSIGESFAAWYSTRCCLLLVRRSC